MRKRSGISLLILVAALTHPLPAAKRKAAVEAYVLLDGTVFRETGFAMPNAEVVVIPDDQPDKSASKVKKMLAVSDGRGEFAFRLPTVNMRYVVKVSAKGYRSAEKPVLVQGEDRIDVMFQLQPEPR
jgi:hypothetical protein